MATLRRTINFTVESRLLQELGERLVSSADVAVSEIIKNAYDADSPDCALEYQEGDFLKIVDRGHGMTLDDFKTRWMSIATSKKTTELFSPKYDRVLTGSKGVGRFAVRVLGRHLTLETVSKSRNKKGREKVKATFDWEALDKVEQLTDLKIPYEYDYPCNEPLGTTLIVTKLNANLSEEDFRKIRTQVLSIASPISGLRPKDGFFKTRPNKRPKHDPGFEIKFTDAHDNSKGPADLILSNYAGRVEIVLNGKNLDVMVDVPGEKPVRKSSRIPTTLGTNIYADIRYFPQRKGSFHGIGIDGRSAWKWIRKNHGVRVFDKGFGVSPYGHEHDDWLKLDADSAHSERDWRSRLSKKHMPMSENVRKTVHLNPMVNIPTNYQLVGAVFVQTPQAKSANDSGLTPSMDRQGFVENRAFGELADVIRFGIEFLANQDKQIQLRNEERERKQEHKNLQIELKAAIAEIEASPTLERRDKSRIVKQYRHLYENVQDLEDYDRRSREQMDLMGFLGVVAGFMTHEYESALWELQAVQKLIENLPKKDKRFAEAATKIDANIQNISQHVEYTRLFIRNINTPVKSDLAAKPRIRHAINAFSHFAKERHFNVEDRTKKSEIMPAVPIPMYEGIVTNLYTNALKALVAAPKVTNPSILIVAWSDAKNRYLSVSDNGTGIPKATQGRIWDPLFTTTSGEENPLGSGMGLGLPLIKRVIETMKGKIEIVSPPPEFTTRFKVTFPRETVHGKN